MSDYLTNPHQNVKICNFSVPFSVYRGVPKKLVLEKSLLKSVLKDKKQGIVFHKKAGSNKVFFASSSNC